MTAKEFNQILEIFEKFTHQLERIADVMEKKLEKEYGKEPVKP